MNSVMLDIYESALPSFEMADRDQAPAEDQRHMFQAWLGKPLEWEVKRMLEKRQPATNLSLKELSRLADRPRKPEAVVSQMELDVREAIGLLTHAERAVVRLSIEFFAPHVPQGHFPKSKVNDLAIELGVKKDTIRVLRLRAYGKIRKHLEKLGYQVL